MSDHAKNKKTPKPPQACGWIAEYSDENQLLDASRQVRDSGYTRTDAFTPFPVHGIDDALGIKATVLPWFTLCAGFTGITVALLMQWWMNAVDYPYIISGKPFASWPAFIPVAFELTVLFSAFTTVFGMLGLNGLPRFSNPFFANPKFDRVTDDRFYLWIDSRDKYFNSDKVKSLLTATGALSVEEVREDATPTEIPKPLVFGIVALILVTLIPGAVILNMRNAKSGQPRLHVFFDMDFQPSKHAQSKTTLFADGRSMRPPVAGTVARGQLGLSDPYILGYIPEELAADTQPSTAARLVSFQEDTPDSGTSAATDTPDAADTPDATSGAAVAAEQAGSAPATETPAAETPAAEDAAMPATATGPNFDWLTELPVEANDELYELGRHKYEQNCSVCHGFDGYGNGLVAQRAAALAQSYWLQPTSLHDDAIQKQAVGHLYYTITHGKGKMGSYAASLTPQERWAVVFYVRALQRSQNAQASDVPSDGTVRQ